MREKQENMFSFARSFFLLPKNLLKYNQEKISKIKQIVEWIQIILSAQKPAGKASESNRK